MGRGFLPPRAPLRTIFRGLARHRINLVEIFGPSGTGTGPSVGPTAAKYGRSNASKSYLGKSGPYRWTMGVPHATALVNLGPVVRPIGKASGVKNFDGKGKSTFFVFCSPPPGKWCNLWCRQCLVSHFLQYQMGLHHYPAH